MDGVAVTVKLAANELGCYKVAKELRRLADYLEHSGQVPGWNFPRDTNVNLKERARHTTQSAPEPL